MSYKQYPPSDPKSAVSASESLADTVRNRRTAWTADELAELLTMSPKTIHKFAKEGRIPSILIGGSRRFDPKRTADWLESKQ